GGRQRGSTAHRGRVGRVGSGPGRYVRRRRCPVRDRRAALGPCRVLRARLHAPDLTARRRHRRQSGGACGQLPDGDRSGRTGRRWGAGAVAQGKGQGCRGETDGNGRIPSTRDPPARMARETQRTRGHRWRQVAGAGGRGPATTNRPSTSRAARNRPPTTPPPGTAPTARPRTPPPGPTRPGPAPGAAHRGRPDTRTPAPPPTARTGPPRTGPPPSTAPPPTRPRPRRNTPTRPRPPDGTRGPPVPAPRTSRPLRPRPRRHPAGRRTTARSPTRAPARAPSGLPSSRAAAC